MCLYLSDNMRYHVSIDPLVWCVAHIGVVLVPVPVLALVSMLMLMHNEKGKGREGEGEGERLFAPELSVLDRLDGPGWARGWSDG